MILKSPKDFSAVIWSEDLIVAGSKDGEIFCIDSNNLSTIFITTLPSPVLHLYAINEFSFLVSGEESF